MMFLYHPEVPATFILLFQFYTLPYVRYLRSVYSPLEFLIIISPFFLYMQMESLRVQR